MADGYDRFDNEGGGGSFVMGLITGTVLGAGLGMLFAPKSGSELRSQLSEQAGNLANSASEGYRRAAEAASDLADRGREVYDKARDAAVEAFPERQSEWPRRNGQAHPRSHAGKRARTGGRPAHARRLHRSLRRAS